MSWVSSFRIELHQSQHHKHYILPQTVCENLEVLKPKHCLVFLWLKQSSFLPLLLQSNFLFFMQSVMGLVILLKSLHSTSNSLWKFRGAKTEALLSFSLIKAKFFFASSPPIKFPFLHAISNGSRNITEISNESPIKSS